MVLTCTIGAILVYAKCVRIRSVSCFPPTELYWAMEFFTMRSRYFAVTFHLPYQGQDKMATISQVTFYNSCMIIAVYWLKFEWELLPRLHPISCHHSDQATSNYLKQSWHSLQTHTCVTRLQGVKKLQKDTNIMLVRTTYGVPFFRDDVIKWKHIPRY